jgi:hypothetical protein
MRVMMLGMMLLLLLLLVRVMVERLVLPHLLGRLRHT